MRIVEKFNYRNAEEILETRHPEVLEEIFDVLEDPDNKIDLETKGLQRNLSAQVQDWFLKKGWTKEKSCFSIPGLKYDLVKEDVVVEIELGHQRLVYADFFEFMADYSKGLIPLGIMIVAGDPNEFGHTWHNSLNSTKRKILAIQETFLVPVLVVAINP